MRIFVYEGYAQYGGTYMAYQLGRICHEQFRLPVFVVGQPAAESSYFSYPYSFPVISLDKMEKLIEQEDVFICNPSFSNNMFGLRLKCIKVMYVQGINTFDVLDRFFDYYVCVSTFVQEFIEKYYGIFAPVINSFVDLRVFNKGIPWGQRDDDILVLAHKYHAKLFLEHLNRKLCVLDRQSGIKFRVVENVSQDELAGIMGRQKYYLTLTPMEGFGLPSLEAMASGCAVIGFDAYGGLDYFRPSQNSFVVSYGDFNKLIDSIVFIKKNEAIAKKVAKRGQEDAQNFSQELFNNKWIKFFRENILTNSRVLAAQLE